MNLLIMILGEARKAAFNRYLPGCAAKILGAHKSTVGTRPAT